MEHHVILKPRLAVQVWARVVLSLPLLVGSGVPVLEGFVVALQVWVHAPLLKVLKGLCALPQRHHDLLADGLRVREDLELEIGDAVNCLRLEGLELHGRPHLLLRGRDVERALLLLVGLSVGLRLVGGPGLLLVVLTILGRLLWFLGRLLRFLSVTLDLQVDRRVEVLFLGLSERWRHELNHVHLVDGVLWDVSVLQVEALGLKEGNFGLAQVFAVVRHLHSGIVFVVNELVEDVLVDLPVQFPDALLYAQLLHGHERLHGDEIVEECKPEDLKEGGAQRVPDLVVEVAMEAELLEERLLLRDLHALVRVDDVDLELVVLFRLEVRKGPLLGRLLPRAFSNSFESLENLTFVAKLGVSVETVLDSELLFLLILLQVILLPFLLVPLPGLDLADDGLDPIHVGSGALPGSLHDLLFDPLPDLPLLQLELLDRVAGPLLLVQIDRPQPLHGDAPAPMGAQYFSESVIQNEEVAPELLLDLVPPLRFDLVAPVLEYLPLPK